MKISSYKTLFVVIRSKGKSWEEGKPMNLQNGWAEHAAFMNQLAEEEFILLGGPIGKNSDIMLIINASDEKEITERLGLDNWSRMKILEIKDIKPWTILLQPEHKSNVNKLKKRD